jgi:hypothetical protein
VASTPDERSRKSTQGVNLHRFDSLFHFWLGIVSSLLELWAEFNTTVGLKTTLTIICVNDTDIVAL